jgi:uncharacterized membrane protein
MSSLDLFVWWALSISFSIIFLAVVSIYLYFDTRSKRRDRERKTSAIKSSLRLIESFAFVWVLLGLLVFYISSIQLGATALTEVVFAIGNVVVEILLILYLIKNREQNS